MRGRERRDGESQIRGHRSGKREGETVKGEQRQEKEWEER